MTVYQRLGPLSATAAALDLTGHNAGNWTAALDTTQITRLTKFECYQMAIDGPVGFGLTVYINASKWTQTAQGWQNSWDPSEPMLLDGGDQIYFLFAAPTTATPTPTVTAWFRAPVG